jgi:hypothetical protein
MWIFAEGSTTIGKARDSNIRPFDFNVKPNHCVMSRLGDALTIVGGDGPIFVNGIKCLSDEAAAASALGKGKSVAEQKLEPYDRIVLGGSLFLFCFPGKNPMRPEPTADEITDEYRSAEQDMDQDMANFAKKLLDAQAEQVKQSGGIGSQSDLELEAAKSMKRKKAMDAVNFEAREMFPKVNEANDLCHSLDRDALTFSVKLQQTALDALVPTVKVQVLNNETEQSIMIDTFEFLRGYSSLKDEYRQITIALDTGRVYNADPQNDPIHQFFNNTCVGIPASGPGERPPPPPPPLSLSFSLSRAPSSHARALPPAHPPATTAALCTTSRNTSCSASKPTRARTSTFRRSRRWTTRR